MIQPTIDFLNNPNKKTTPLSAPGKWYLENTGHRFVDGLFTAPPALAMLYQMTGDEKYVNWMDACFWDVHGEIFDHDAGLFYRDARSIPRKTKNGKKVLWSRGNGWAFGGLTRILKHLPEHHASYARYKALYVQMAESLAEHDLTVSVGVESLKPGDSAAELVERADAQLYRAKDQGRNRVCSSAS